MPYIDIEKKREAGRRYAAKHKERIKAYYQEYKKRTGNKVRDGGRKFYREHRDKELERGKRYRERNKEKICQRCRDYYWRTLERQKERKKLYINKPENAERERLKRFTRKFLALQKVSGERLPICIKCGKTDIRILTINHKNTKSTRDKSSLYLDIMNGRRDTEDLEVCCFNCNTLYEHERGKIKIHEIRKKALYALSNSTPTCIRCEERDMRILTINHVNGLNGEKRKSTYTIHREITKGKKEGFDIRCFNCNILHEYERRKRLCNKELLGNHLKEKGIILPSDSLK